MEQSQTNNFSKTIECEMVIDEIAPNNYTVITAVHIHKIDCLSAVVAAELLQQLHHGQQCVLHMFRMKYAQQQWAQLFICVAVWLCSVYVYVWAHSGL